jgi:hypothetical protein
MNAKFDYDGRTHTFQVSLGPRPQMDGSALRWR